MEGTSRNESAPGRPRIPLHKRIVSALTKYGVLTRSQMSTLTSVPYPTLSSELDDMVIDKIVMKSESDERVPVYYLSENADRTLRELFPVAQEEPEELEPATLELKHAVEAMG